MSYVTDAEFEHEKEIVRRWLQYWQGRMGLSDWQLYVRYYRTTANYLAEGPHDCHSTDAACTVADWKYLKATIHFNIEAMLGSDYTADDFAELVAHELAHCLLDEMRELIPAEHDRHQLDHEERVVTILARSFVRTMRQAPGMPYLPVSGEY